MDGSEFHEYIRKMYGNVGEGQVDKDTAIRMAGSNWWDIMTDEQVVGFQLFQDRLCMPFGDFQSAVERVLGRPVWTHEFARPDGMRNEFLGQRKAPSFEEILAIIPPEKRLIIVGEKEDK